MQDFENEIQILLNHLLKSGYPFDTEFEETWIPLTDIYETKDGIIARIELAGVDPKDIRVSLDGARLIVQGIRKDPDKNQKLSYYQMEINYGYFRRIINLPACIKTKQIKTRFSNGFLEIKLPFDDSSSAEYIAVNIE